MAKTPAAASRAPKHDIDALVAPAVSELTAKHEAREAALPRCREVIQLSANSIRATHRAEFERAEELLFRAADILDSISETLRGHADVYHAGFVHDAQKEYAEASLTLAFVAERPLPGPSDLRIGAAAYLNGLAEAASELRRHLLDSLRHGDLSRCEAVLA
ncbi:MAG TPA: haloacid dehalogenase, partial [Dehalococcoidia bacterium]|nr:haloacid dehalogenase [Dehalococcoidia bacterium]